MNSNFFTNEKLLFIFYPIKPIKKLHAGPPNINSLFFPKIFISTDFFLSLHSMLSLLSSLCALYALALSSLQLSKFFFSFLSSHHLKPPAERPTAWLFFFSFLFSNNFPPPPPVSEASHHQGETHGVALFSDL